MDKFNQQFATQKLRQETSMTSAGATFTSGTGEQTAPRATKKIVKKKIKKEGANIPKDFTDAPSIPNRPSKGGFIYKKIFEELSYVAFNHYRSVLNDAYEDLVGSGDPGIKKVSDAYNSLDIENNPESISKLDNAKDAINTSENLADQQKIYYEKAIDKIKEYLSQSNQKNKSLNEEEGSYFIKISLRDIPEVIEIIKDLYRGSLKQGIINLDRETDVIYIYDKDIAQDLISIFKDDQIEVVSHNVPLEDEEDDDSEFDDGPVTDYGLNQKYPGYYEKKYQRTGKTDFFRRPGGLNESYSKFKNETKTRGKSDQFHQAIKQVKKKVLEINKMYEYVSRLKEELSEGEAGLEYKMHTEKALHKIKEMVSELNKKIKRFK